VISLPYPGRGLEVPFGRALCHAAREADQRWALLASGDMSHRLSPGAPAGFEPRAAVFDQTFRAAMERGDLRAASEIASDLAELAAEDVLQSSTIAAAAIDFTPRGQRMLAYEAPFGVGYLEAVLYSDRITHVAPAHPLLEIAREAIQHALRGQSYTPSEVVEASAPQAVFVTLRGPCGTLRGCVGRTEPRHACLVQEVADCAVGAATRDVRVAPLAPHELSTLAIEVSLLSPPEAVSSPSQLDAQRYGVIVSHGARRGVLLPDVPGIHTVEDQLRIALHKAGISPVDAYTIERFTTETLSGTPA
jgi:AmmeMemoRadiSam system protein A